VHSASPLPAAARADRLVLLPAVDLAGGQAVQLVQGRAGSEKRFGDPRAAAQRWQDAGAEWIHLVDLDAAFGRGSNAEIIDRYGDRIAVGLDVRGSKLAARGWTREGGDLFETLHRLDSAGCARFVVTDVSADGMLRGPNLELLLRVCEETEKPVIASGGISTLEDILALRDMIEIGVEGAIIGTALYVGRFTIEEALVAAQLGSTTGSNSA
jgi:phosphoribosyl isomerase A